MGLDDEDVVENDDGGDNVYGDRDSDDDDDVDDDDNDDDDGDADDPTKQILMGTRPAMAMTTATLIMTVMILRWTMEIWMTM